MTANNRTIMGAELRSVLGWEYKRVELHTAADRAEAQRLAGEGWQVVRASPFTISFQRRKPMSERNLIERLGV